MNANISVIRRSGIKILKIAEVRIDQLAIIKTPKMKEIQTQLKLIDNNRSHMLECQQKQAKQLLTICKT